VNVQTLTANIRALPDRTRHIVAGIVANRMQGKKPDSPQWRALWKMSSEHEANHEWISGEELGRVMLAVGVPDDVVCAAVKAYTAHSLEPARGKAFHQGRNRASMACDERAQISVDSKYEWSGPA